jgi:hypothetical protein
MVPITINKPQLRAALLKWERNYRAGNTLSPEETRLLPAEEVAAQSADQLWEELDATKEL